MQTDVPVGCYLTGGLDSTSIAVTATKYNNNKPLHVFNAFIADKVKLEHGGDHDNYNSRKLAEEHGMKFHQIRIDKNFYLNNIVDIVNMHDELFLDTGTMIYYGVCKEAKKYVKVLLDGVAGDELLGGYPWQRHLRMIPYPMLKLLNKIIPYNRSLYLSLDRYSRAISQLYKLVSNYALFHIQGLQMIGNKSFGNDPHFNEEILSKINKSNFSTAINAIPNDFKNAINYCNFFSFVCHQNNNSDRSSMRYSIEGRSPYLDYRLVELCLGIDSKIKNKKGHKSLQREIFKDLLPDYIINAPKSGPSLPIKYWYHSDKGLRLKTDEYIEKNLNILEIILGKHIIQTFKENPNQLINRNLFLHHIFLVLIIWGKKNIEKKIINSDLPLYDFMDSY